MIRKHVILTMAVAMFGLYATCWAQDQQLTQQPSIDTVIAIIRTGMQTDRDIIIGKAMSLNEKDAAAFWPIYRKYEYERAALDDRRAAVIKQYAVKYPNLTDAEAKDMADRMFESESGIAALKKKYFKEFNKVLPALTVAKFFQMDHRVDIVMDMKVEAALPSLAEPPSTDEKQDEENKPKTPSRMPGS